MPLDHAENVAAPEPSPHEELEKAELKDRVMQAIKSLPRKQGETVTLFYINGYSIKDIAAMQEAPVGSIKRRLHDARERLKEDMLGMVEDTLKAEAPKEEFAERVFELLNREGRSREPSFEEIPGIVSELKEIGNEGVDGLLQALKATDRNTRDLAMWMIKLSGVAPEPVVDLLKQFLTHTNQQMRGNAAAVLMRLNLQEERKRREFVPLILPLLSDATRYVRAAAAESLLDSADSVPLEAAARALAKETDGRVRRHLAPLVLGILDGQEKN